MYADFTATWRLFSVMVQETKERDRGVYLFYKDPTNPWLLNAVASKRSGL